MRKSARKISHVALALVAIVAIIVMLVQISISGALIWANTAPGQSWLRGQVERALAGSGYQIAFDSMSYMAAEGLAVNNLVVRDAEGVIAEADRLSLRIGILELAARQLSLSLQGAHVILHRLPQGGAEEKPESEFAVPDIFFRRIIIDRTAIGTLDLAEGVMGPAMSLSPRLRADIALGEGIDGNIALAIGQKGESPVIWLPEDVVIDAGYAATGEIEIREFSLNAPLYRIVAEGKVALEGDDPVGIEFSGSLRHLDKIAPDLAGDITLEGELSGTADAPLLQAKGVIDLDQFEARQVKPVEISLSAKNLFDIPEGIIALASAYQNRPVALQSAFAWRAPVLELSAMEGSAPDLALSGNANLDTGTMLATGNILIKLADLATYQDLLKVEMAGSGEIALNLLAGETQGVAVKTKIIDARYGAMRLQRGDIDVTLKNIATRWPDDADITLKGFRPASGIVVNTAKAKLKKGEGEDYHLALQSAGDIGQPFTLKGKADLSGLAQAMPDIRNIALDYRARDSVLNVTGAVDAKGVDLKAKTKRFALADLPIILPDKIAATILRGDASLNGALDAPVMETALVLNPPSFGGNIRLDVTGDYRNRGLNLSMKGSGDGIRTLNGRVAMPVHFSLQPFAFEMNPASKIDGSAAFDLDGATLARSFLPPEHAFSGNLKGQADIGGTIGKPDLSGAVNLSGGDYRFETYGVALHDLALSARLQDNKIRLQSLSANDGEAGSLRGDGVIGIGKEGGTRIDLSLDRMHLLRGDKADGFISADLSISDQHDGYLIKGGVKPQQMDVIIPEQFQSHIPELNIVIPGEKQKAESLRIIALDIDIDAPRRIFVRGWGLDAEFGGNIDVTGDLSDPQLNGVFKSVRGRYEEFGKRFTIDHANLRFQGSVPPSPYLDIEAVTQAEDVQASVMLSGPVTKPGIKFASVPALPEDEVLSRILFGKDMSTITPFQAIQLAQTLQRFSGKGGGPGFNPLGRLRSATGLDDVSVGTDESGQTNVGVGKYLTDKVYLELEKGQGEASGAASIQVEMTPNITAESKIGQDAKAGGGLFWKWDY